MGRNPSTPLPEKRTYYTAVIADVLADALNAKGVPLKIDPNDPYLDTFYEIGTGHTRNDLSAGGDTRCVEWLVGTLIPKTHEVLSTPAGKAYVARGTAHDLLKLIWEAVQ